MKVEINNKEQNTEIKFPCLMLGTLGTIVYATESYGESFAGTSLNDDRVYRTDWMHSAFTPFTGSITLSND
jgi:hypothetical protein